MKPRQLNKLPGKKLKERLYYKLLLTETFKKRFFKEWKDIEISLCRKKKIEPLFCAPKKILVYVEKINNFTQLISFCDSITTKTDLVFKESLTKKEIKRVKKNFFIDKVLVTDFHSINFQVYSFFFYFKLIQNTITETLVFQTALSLGLRENSGFITFSSPKIMKEKRSITVSNRELCKRLNVDFSQFYFGNFIFFSSFAGKISFLDSFQSSDNLDDYLFLMSLKTKGENYIYEQKNYNKYEHNLFSYDENNYKQFALSFQTLSFDIFDTLLARRLYQPDDLFDLLALKLNNKKFKEKRKRAEQEARNRLKKDVNLKEIYDVYAELFSLSKNEVEHFLKEEISLEKRLLLPRKRMVNFLKEMKSNGKKIIITSDMYLPETVVKDILKMFSIPYDALYLSNACNRRKDDGSMWKLLKAKEGEFLHFGDNEYSDYQMAYENESYALKISSAKETSLKFFTFEIHSLADSLVYGQIINEFLFNDPFIQNETEFYPRTKEMLAKVILAPIFISFFQNLFLKIKQKPQVLLYISREGYYLKQMHEKMIEIYQEFSHIKYLYFYASRRASSIAAAETLEDLYEITETNYEGTLFDFFYYRFGYSLDKTAKNTKVKLPDDKEMVKLKIKEEKDSLLMQAQQEKKNYYKYVDKTLLPEDLSHLCIIDLGYSGTTQYYLSKIIKKKISGYYFLVSDKLKPLKLKEEVDACFNYENHQSNIKHPLYRYNLLLESFLTAKNGQLIFFNEKGDPIFLDTKEQKKKFELLDTFLKSILEQFDFLFSLLSLENSMISKKNIEILYLYYLQYMESLDQEIKDNIEVEDFYSQNKIWKWKEM